MHRLRSIAIALFVAALASCCTAAPSPQAASASVPGKVTDVATFEQFIATRPTPAEFRRRYPDVVLVLPGAIATKELRMDRSRYFAELDGDGRITGGKFQ